MLSLCSPSGTYKQNARHMFPFVRALVFSFLVCVVCVCECLFVLFLMHRQQQAQGPGHRANSGKRCRGSTNATTSTQNEFRKTRKRTSTLGVTKTEPQPTHIRKTETRAPSLRRLSRPKRVGTTQGGRTTTKKVGFRLEPKWLRTAH